MCGRNSPPDAPDQNNEGARSVVGDDSRSTLSVFVASRLLEAVESEWRDSFRLVVARSDDPLSELRDRVADGESIDVVLFSLDVRMGASEIGALPARVRALATYSVGTDHIDLAAAKRRGLRVFNTPGVLADSVAENALFLMLGAARRATESIELVRSRRWAGWTPTQLVGVQLAGRTLGIFGMGNIGLRVAIRANALGMSILYCNRKPRPTGSPFAGGYRDSIRALVAEADVLLLASPSTRDTRGIVDGALLEAARPGLILVNIARGDLVDDGALVSALRDGRVRAAGLDVFAGEPRIDSRYFELPNVFMLPHIGSSTIEARLGMGRILIEALRTWQAGGVAENRVV